MSKAIDTRLLTPGWAGELTVEEAEFIARRLVEDASLRRLWGFKRRKRYPLTLIAERAFPEQPEKAKRLMLNALAARNRRDGIALPEMSSAA